MIQREAMRAAGLLKCARRLCRRKRPPRQRPSSLCQPPTLLYSTTAVPRVLRGRPLVQFLQRALVCLNSLQESHRIKLERRRLRSTLDKVERSDVKGNEESLLAPEELTVLKQWRKRECWLLAELGRLDDIVILADGPLTLVDVENT